MEIAITAERADEKGWIAFAPEFSFRFQRDLVGRVYPKVAADIRKAY